jgi:iron complex outermembrane recepter protein
LITAVTPASFAQTRPTAAEAESAASGDVVVLSAFNVSAEAEDRYRAADAISAVRIRAPLIDTPSSITVITRDMMDDLAPTRMFDVTRYVAGVQEGRGIQFQDRVILRGFESTGQRTVDNFLQPGDADNINEAVIDRIEITKGPNAILSPSGAPGGAVNVVTKSPMYTTRRSITGILGLFDAQKVTLDMTGAFSPGSPFAYRLVAAGQDTRRYWSKDARLRTAAVAPMFSWRISENTQLTVKLVAAEAWIFREPLLILDPNTTASTKKPQLAPGISPRGLNGIQKWSHVGTHTADLFTQLTHTFNENISLRFAANGRYYFEDSDQQFLSTPSLNNRYNPYTGELTQDYTWALQTAGQPHNATTNPYVSTFSPFFNPTAIPSRRDDQATRRKTGNFQTDVLARYQWGAVSSQTVFGLGLSRQNQYGRGRNMTMPPIDLTRPTEYAKPDPVAGQPFAFYNANGFTNWQFYVNERLGFFQDRLYLTGGILRFETKTTARNVLTGAAPSVLDDGKNMYMAAALYKVRDNISVYFSHSTNSSPAIANNQPLWRDGEQDEVGFKTEFFNRRLAINGAYFEITQTNVTIPNPARQTDPTAPEQLVSDFGNKGWELELMGSITPELSAVLTYSNLDMKDSLGRRVRAVADDTASLLLNYRFGGDSAFSNLALNLGVNYVGRRAGDVPINYTPLGVVGKTSFFLESYYATTFGASYKWRDYNFRLVVDNILDDKDFIVVAGGRVSGTGITTQPGINAKLAVTLNF